MSSAKLLNQVYNIESKSYLELGVGNNINYSLVRCRRKMSVDTNGLGFFHGTTDEFFSRIDKSDSWDFVFIDANHDLEFVVRDFNNSIRHCKEWALIHDMIPPSKRYTASRFCSDSFRLLYHFWTKTDFDVYSMDGYFGLTFVRMPVKPVENIENVSYEKFMRVLDGVRLCNEKEVLEVLNG